MEVELREVQCLFIRKGKLKFLYQNPRPKDHPQTFHWSNLIKSKRKPSALKKTILFPEEFVRQIKTLKFETPFSHKNSKTVLFRLESH